jgi:hypothetical protein
MNTSLQSLKSALEQLEEGRKAKGRIYPQSLLLCLAVIAKLCGYHAYAEMARFVKRHPWLLPLLGFNRNELPCDDTFRYAFKHVNVDEVEAVLGEWATVELEALEEPEDKEEAAVPSWQGHSLDGKSLRGSVDKLLGQKATHLLALLQHKYHTVIAERLVDTKTNEIPVAKELLRGMNLLGMVITADALLTQRKLAATIEEQKGRYIFMLKANQPGAVELVSEVFRPDLPPLG